MADLFPTNQQAQVPQKQEQITISLRMDGELKRQFEAFCDDVGMTMTTAFTIFAKKTVRENRIPFEITGSSKANER